MNAALSNMRNPPNMRVAHIAVAWLAALLLLVWVLAPAWSGKGMAHYAAVHTIIEVASIVVSVMIFAVWWGTRAPRPDMRTALVAVAFLCVALLDLMHTLSYPDMPDFVTPADPEKAIYFWLAARLIAALGLLVAVCYQVPRHLAPGRDYLWLAAGLLLVAAVAWGVLLHRARLPSMFVAGQGLTPLKVVCEYGLVVLYGIAAYCAWRQSGSPARTSLPRKMPYLYAAAAISALSEVFFTLYGSVTDAYNFFGHVYKVIAYAFLYHGVVTARVVEPFHELQKNEEVLREREAQLAGIVASLKLAVISVDEAQNIVLFNRQAEAIFRCPAAEALGGSLDRFIPARSRAPHRQLVAAYDGVGEHGTRHMGGERILTGLRADGEEFPIDASISRTVIGGRTRFTVVLRDVTERMRVQQELQRNADIIASSGDAIVSRKPSGAILTWNPAAERLFGYRAEEMIGRDISLLYSPHTPPEHRDLMARAIRGEPVMGFETVRRRKDGSDVNVAITLSAVRDAAGQVISSSAIYRDITERKRMEAQLLRSLHDQREAEVEVRESRDRLRELSAALQTIREEEKTRIARELHDELGQALTALKMDTAAIESELDHAQAALRKRTADMKQLIDTTVTSVRRISADLRPVMLDNLGLVPTLEWLTREFSKRTGIEVELNIPDENLGASGDAATAIFRIVQESLTNVARHAQASKVTIDVTHRGGNVALRIADDGKGMEDADKRKTRSFGLLGMRERAFVLGGELKVSSTPGKGTVVEALIPRFGTGQGEAA